MRLAVVFEDGSRAIAKNTDGQLYVSTDTEPRKFEPIDAYETRHDAQGNVELVDCVYSLSETNTSNSEES